MILVSLLMPQEFNTLSLMIHWGTCVLLIVILRANWLVGTTKISILYNFFSDLTLQGIIYMKGYIFVCMVVEYLTFDILVHAKSDEKYIGN